MLPKMNQNDEFGMEREIINAKAYMHSAKNSQGQNLYDHLVRVVSNLLHERPSNPLEIFEDLSRDAKAEALDPKTEPYSGGAEELAMAQINKKLFSNSDHGEGSVADDPMDTPLPNLLEHSYYFEQTGIGIVHDELIRVWLAMKKLVDVQPLQKVRFWGKIFGLEQNYYIVEAEYRDGEEPEEATEEEEADKKSENALEKKSDGGDDDEETKGEEEEVEEKLPAATWRPPPAVPREEYHSGTNRKVYFACNLPGADWRRLPPVLPAQLVVARRIRKYLTGRFDAPIVSYPPFPGTEINYLRAQIARISAATQISPSGFYQFDEEDELEEGAAGRETFVENEEFVGLTLADLVDQSLGAWVHHVQYILPQGRCHWWNPQEARRNGSRAGDDDDDDDGDEAGGGAEEEAAEPESGPPLLTPISEDVPVDGLPAWVPSVSSKLMPSNFSIAVLRSNLWPGAVAYAVPGRKLFENTYVGWGCKYLSENLTPAPAGEQQSEFMPSEAMPAAISEALDPTPEQERALNEARKRAEAALLDDQPPDELDGGADEMAEPPGLTLDEPDE